MAMAPANSANGIASGINVTPLIDVLLVLLIIFMVISPVMPRGLSAQLPQPAKQKSGSESVVVSVLNGAGSGVTYRINQETVAKNDLLPRLTAIYAKRADRTMFVRGDNEVEYSQIAQVIDTGHSAGVDRVALMTPKIEMGQ